MTVGTYTALGFRWATIGSGRVLHLTPTRLGPLSTAACGRPALGNIIYGPGGEQCGRCLDKDGTAGPKRDGRAEMGLGQ